MSCVSELSCVSTLRGVRLLREYVSKSSAALGICRGYAGDMHPLTITQPAWPRSRTALRGPALAWVPGPPFRARFNYA